MFNHYKWGENADGSNFAGRKPLKSHPCTREELGLEGDPSQSKFLPINENFRGNIEFYHKKFLCLEKEDLVVYGDFGTARA